MINPNDQQSLKIISLGGSLVVPNEIDVSFLKSFKNLIEQQINDHKRRFVIIVGGGKTARSYQRSARDLGVLNDEDADWLGIHSTRLNAHLLRTIFKDHAYPKLFSDPQDIVHFDEPVAVGAGWRPGWSTDFVSVSIAEKIGAKQVVNLSNTSHVYDSDPAQNPDARKLPNISWAEYRRLIPEEWVPGLNSPFDPIASRKAEELEIEVAVMNGADLDNFGRYLDGGFFEGTTIK